jgi:septal ring-binding cell division protein DamX
MHLRQYENALNAGTALFVVCLLIGGCATNNNIQATSEHESWIRCESSVSGDSWNCSKGESSGSDSNESEPERPLRDREERRKTSPVSSEGTPGAGTFSPVQETENSTNIPEVPAGTDSTSRNDADGQARYSIQLAAFLSRERRDSSLPNIELGQVELQLSQSQSSGRTWWLVLYGSYREYAEALEAQAELVQSHGLTGTWIKPLH